MEVSEKDTDDRNMTEFADSTLVAEILTANSVMISNLAEIKTSGEENVELVYGKHQTEEELSNYDENHIPLSLPAIYPKMQSLLGYEKQNREQFEVEAEREEDELLAEIYNAIFRHIENRADPKKYRYSRSDCFGNSTIKKFGALEIYTEQNDLGDMEIKLRSLPFSQIAFDMNFFDVECTAMSRVQHYYDCYLDDLIKQYPELKDDLNRIEESLNTDSFNQINNKNLLIYQDNIYPDKKRVRVIRDWLKRTKTYYRVTDTTTGDVFEYENKKEADDKKKELIKKLREQIKIKKEIATLAQEAQIQAPIEITEIKDTDIISKSFEKSVIQYSLLAGTVLLDQPRILEVDEMPIKLMFCLFIDGKFVSVVDILKDLQKYVDRLMTQLDYNMGINGKTVYGVDIEKIDESANTVDEVKETNSKGGYIFTKGNPREALLPIDKSAIDPTYFKMSEILFNLMEDAGGGRNFQGKSEGTAQSGRAISNLLAVAQVMTQNIIDNIQRFDEQVCKTIIKYIQQYYTYEMTVKVLGNSLTDKVKQKLQEKSIYKESTIHENIGWLIVNQGKYYEERPLDSAKLNIVIRKQTSRIEENEILFQKLNLLVQSGYPIPPDVMLEAVELKATMKQKIIAAFEEQKKQQAEQMDLEKKKLQVQGNLKSMEEVRKGYETLNKTNPQEPKSIVSSA